MALILGGDYAPRIAPRQAAPRSRGERAVEKLKTPIHSWTSEWNLWTYSKFPTTYLKIAAKHRTASLIPGFLPGRREIVCARSAAQMSTGHLRQPRLTSRREKGAEPLSPRRF